MFEPQNNRNNIEQYLARHLGYPVVLVEAKPLTQSTRQAPWKLTVDAGGTVEAYVLQLDPGSLELEYRVLKAMERVPIPTPKAYGLDLSGKGIGTPCFFSTFIEGEPLLAPMVAGEPWAEDLYLNTVSELQSVTADDLGHCASLVGFEPAVSFLEDAYADLKAASWPLADVVYQELKRTMPDLPSVRFSNGDLWLENFIVKDQRLAGVIDFANASFSDPVYEFLLSFFVAPELGGRGIEARYCRRMGYDPAMLPWYHGLEFFDTLRWVLTTGEDFVHHTKESLEADLRVWLEQRSG